MAEVERYTTTLMAGNISISLWWQQTLEGIRASERADGSLTDEREAQYQALTAPLTDPSFWLLTALLHGCSGQRPVRQ
jgi:hypothetical protein